MSILHHLNLMCILCYKNMCNYPHYYYMCVHILHYEYHTHQYLKYYVWVVCNFISVSMFACVCVRSVYMCVCVRLCVFEYVCILYMIWMPKVRFVGAVHVFCIHIIMYICILILIHMCICVYVNNPPLRRQSGKLLWSGVLSMYLCVCS